MSPPNNGDSPIFSNYHGMMVFFFSNRTNLVREFQRLGKILEFEDALQSFDSIHFFDLPLRDLGMQQINFTISHGRLPSLTRNTLRLR